MKANLNYNSIEVDNGQDSIVIVNCLSDVPGGATLDVSAVASGVDVIKAGHVIIKKANGNYAPLAISSGAYASVTSGDTIVGVLKASVLVSDPRAAIMTIGSVNAAASPYPVTDAVKTALPAINFLY